MKRRHKNDTRSFRELSFSEQDRSIRCVSMNLRMAMQIHIENAVNSKTAITQFSVKKKCLSLLKDIKDSLLTDCSH